MFKFKAEKKKKKELKVSEICLQSESEAMKEICVIIFFVFANSASSASVNSNNKILESFQKPDLSQSELNFFANSSTVLINVGRNKQLRKRTKDMIKKPQIPPINGDPVEAIQSRIPCECKKGVCSCCLGGIFFNNKGCMHLRYMPEDFAFELKMTFNDNVLYKNTMSGKNPRPICISPPRFGQWIEMCAKFHNIYFIGRNVHLCLDISATIGEFDLIDR